MGAVVSGSCASNAQATQIPANPNLPAYAISPIVYTSSFGNGTLADQIDFVFYTTLSLVASTPQTITVNSPGSDILGNTVTFTKIRRLRIRNNANADGKIVTISPGASNPWLAIMGTSTSTVIIQPSTANNSGWVEFVSPNTSGYATSGTSTSLKLDPGTNTMTVDIEIWGI